MRRVTLTLEDDLLAALDEVATGRGYGSRSEALRDLVRGALGREAAAGDDRPSYGTLSYVYDHAVRDLPGRLVGAQHVHHELTVATLHVHLDSGSCLEVVVLRGRSGELRSLADIMTSQRGVRFGELHLVPDESTEPHHHHHGASPAPAERVG